MEGMTLMNFLQEKQSARYFFFTLLFCLLLLLSSLLLAVFCARGARNAMLEREGEIASGLLEAGIPAGTVASAFKNVSVTSEGSSFLEKIGHTQSVSSGFYPAVGQSARAFLLLSFCLALGLSLLLLTVSVLFLHAREQLYLEAADTISRFSEGDFQTHLPRDETGTLFLLFSSVNQLADALRAQMESEHRAKEFLREMISDISHQLKTPLAALEMYMEIISEEPDNPSAVANFSQKASSALERMEQLISSLLKIARLDAGSIVFKRTPCRMDALICRATENLLTRAKVEHKTIQTQGEPEAVLFCDPQWTAEAIGNLVKNALDHTAAGGLIRIQWQQSPAMLRLSVSDNGSGIAPEDIHHIFKRFYRSRRAENQPGIGLGLSLAKSVTEGQGGILSVQSTLGEGTVFTLSFLTDL